MTRSSPRSYKALHRSTVVIPAHSSWHARGKDLDVSRGLAAYGITYFYVYYYLYHLYENAEIPSIWNKFFSEVRSRKNVCSTKTRQKIYVESRFENVPLSIMDDPASMLRRAVPVLMTGPVNCGHFQYGDRDLVMFVDGLGMFFFWRHSTLPKQGPF